MTTASLTVKAAAEMLLLPAHSQARILTEQKHPKVGSQAFKVPYYRTAIGGMVAFFRKGGSVAELDKARVKAQNFNQRAKRTNNLRAIDSFQKSRFSGRAFEVATSPRLSATIDNVEIRLSPDLRVMEESKTKFIYLNCKAEAIDSGLARRTLEIGHWVFEKAGHELPMMGFEYVDLVTDQTYSYKTRRRKTITAMQENAKVISVLWPSL